MLTTFLLCSREIMLKFIFLSKGICYKNKTLHWTSIYKMKLMGMKWGSRKEKVSLLDYSIHPSIHSPLSHSLSIYSHLDILVPESFTKPVFSVNQSMLPYMWKEFMKVFLCQPALDLGPWGQFKAMDSYTCCVLHKVLGDKNIDLVLTKFSKLWSLINK